MLLRILLQRRAVHCQGLWWYVTIIGITRSVYFGSPFNENTMHDKFIHHYDKKILFFILIYREYGCVSLYICCLSYVEDVRQDAYTQGVLTGVYKQDT